MTTVALGPVTAEVEGEGPAVVFVHGLGASSNSFQPLIGALDRHRLIRLDLPGSARSKLPYEKITLDNLVRAVIEAVRTLGVTRAHVVGHSMGALISQHIAAQNPDLVASLALFGPILEPSQAGREHLRERARLARSHGMAPVADAVCAAGLSSATKAEAPVAVAFVRESHMRQSEEGFAQSCEALAEAVAADLRAVRCPAVLVTGDEDAVAPPSMAQAIADKLKGAKVKILPRCGHWTPIEKPGECARALSEFLAEAGR